MRIHSKFQDYYDSALGYGIDPNCHYVRHTEEFKKRPDIKGAVATPYDHITDLKFIRDCQKTAPYLRYTYNLTDRKIISAKTYIFLFCGKMYVGIRFDVGITRNVNTKLGVLPAVVYKWAYNAYDVKNIVLKYGNKKEKDCWTKNKQRGRQYTRMNEPFGNKWFSRYKIDNPKHITEFFEKYQGVDRPDFVEYHHLTGIPSVMIEAESLFYNPILKDYEFFKVVDAFQAFQELSMFISGVLGGQSPKMVEISDNIRIEKHGFDKMSFRKEKKTK